MSKLDWKRERLHYQVIWDDLEQINKSLPGSCTFQLAPVPPSRSSSWESIPLTVTSPARIVHTLGWTFTTPKSFWKVGHRVRMIGVGRKTSYDIDPPWSWEAKNCQFPEFSEALKQWVKQSQFGPVSRLFQGRVGQIFCEMSRKSDPKKP